MAWPAPSPTTKSTVASDLAATSIASGSVTLVPGSCVLILVLHTRSAAIPSQATSVTGTSISGAQNVLTITFSTIAAARVRLELWSAVSTGLAGAITASWGAESQSGLSIVVEEWQNVDITLGTNGVRTAQSGRAYTGVH